jgi:hypothetical protein
MWEGTTSFVTAGDRTYGVFYGLKLPTQTFWIPHCIVDNKRRAKQNEKANDEDDNDDNNKNNNNNNNIKIATPEANDDSSHSGYTLTGLTLWTL